MILVVIGHSPDLPGWIYKTIFSFHMPLFFFLSGFVYRENSGVPVGNNDQKLKKDIRYLFLPYAASVFLVGVSQIILQSQGKWVFYHSIPELCKSALYGFGSDYAGIKMIGELWFLPTMFWARRYIEALFLCENRHYRLILVCALVGIGIGLASEWAWLPSDIDIAMVAAGFMYAGWVVHKKPELIDNHSFLCAMFLIYVAARLSAPFEMTNRNYYHMWYISIPGAIAMSVIICKLSKVLCGVCCLRSFLAFVGRHSLLFFCVHALDWRIPFPMFGISYIRPYAGESWYWALSALHRFSFDLIVTILLLGAGTVLKRIIRNDGAK